MDKRIITWEKVVTRLVVSVAFIVLVGWLALWSSGLRYNAAEKRWEQTCIISVKDTSRENVKVFLNGKQISNELPFTQRHLSAGRYDLVISQDGFYDWEKMYNLDAGQAGWETYITLIAKVPLVTTVAESDKWNEFTPFDSGIVSDDSGFYDNDKFITRFLGSPSQMKRLQDGYIYQVGKQIRIIFPNRNQDYLIYEADSDKVAPMFVTGSWQVTVKLSDKRIITLDLDKANAG